VSKVAIKYVTVATQQGLWKVPANMLEAVWARTFVPWAPPHRRNPLHVWETPWQPYM
jgi:hypothetical protein